MGKEPVSRLVLVKHQEKFHQFPQVRTSEKFPCKLNHQQQTSYKESREVRHKHQLVFPTVTGTGESNLRVPPLVASAAIFHQSNGDIIPMNPNWQKSSMNQSFFFIEFSSAKAFIVLIKPFFDRTSSSSWT